MELGIFIVKKEMHLKNSAIFEPGRKVPIVAESEVIVIGAGPAGFAAALAAKRAGASTILIEKGTFFGGTLTQATLGNFCGLFSVTDSDIIPVVQGIAMELIDRLVTSNYACEPHRLLKTATVSFDVTGLKFVMDDMVTESGLTPILDAMVVGVTVVDDGRIDGVFIETKSGRGYVKGDIFIDASGDADVASFAGLDLDFDPNNLQASSSMFEFHGVDTRCVTTMASEDIERYLVEAVTSGRYKLPRLAGGIHVTPRPGKVHCNITKVSIDGRPLNPLDLFESTRGEIDGRRQVREYERFFRDCVPGFKDAYVGALGTLLGVRESRRLKSDYILTADDLFSCCRFEDAIAASAWPVEMHGKGPKAEWVWIEPGNYYQIPYRSTLSSRCPNLFVVGRCMSATHEAHASLRVSGPCFAIGQAAGTAAAIASSFKLSVADVPIRHLQSLLREQGAFF